MLVQLRDSTESDLEIFFENQRDEEASYMAAFTSENHTDREAYLNKWTRLLKDPTIHMKTILADHEIAGTVVKFEIDGEAEITYALGKNFWGKGIATKALQKFLPLELISKHLLKVVPNGSKKRGCLFEAASLL